MADSRPPVSPVSASRPELTFTTAAINDEPVELDSTPTSSGRGNPSSIGAAPSKQEQKAKSKLIADRKDDPAVLVDIPQTPGAEEFNKSDEATAATKT